MPEHTKAEQRVISRDIKSEMSKGTKRPKAIAIALSKSRKRQSLLSQKRK